MKRKSPVLFLFTCVCVSHAACGDDDAALAGDADTDADADADTDTDTDADTDSVAELRVVGALGGAAGGSGEEKKIREYDPEVNDGGCYDNNPDNPVSGDGVSRNLSPVTYTVAMKRFTLLGTEGTGTANYDVFWVESIEEAHIVDFEDATSFYNGSQLPPPGSYDGFEMEFFYLGMGLADVRIPAISDEPSTSESPFAVRMYFADDGNVLKRDFVVEHPAGTWNWIDVNGDPLYPTASTNPGHVIDLFANDEFWNQDPIVVSTKSSIGGMNFFYDGPPMEIAADESYIVTLTFDVANSFSFWEWLDDEHPEGDGIYDFGGGDCGIHPMLPPVRVDVENP